MTQPLALRCSSLPLHFKCPGSARPARVPVNATNDAADVGTAGHEGLAGLVRTGQLDLDTVAPALASKHAVDEAELRVLLALGAKLWNQVKGSFPNASAEVALKHELSPSLVTGHVDVSGSSGTTLRIADWKLGRLDSDYREQLLGYCALSLLATPSATKAEAGILWVREQEYEPHSMDKAGLYDWLLRVEHEIVRWDGVFRPGSHCQYCPRSHECPAANALARRDMAILMNEDLPGQLEDQATLREMVKNDPDKVVALVEKMRFFEKLAERGIAAIKAEVMSQGDVLGTDKRLTLTRTEKRHLNVLQAFPLLQQEGFEDEDMAQVMSISLSKAETLVAKRAGKGNGAKAVRALDEKLAQAGAIETSTSANLVVRRQA
jgi:hypothetical protein